MKPIDRTRISLQSFEIARKLRKRHAADTRFEFYGFATILIAMSFMAILIGTILYNGWSAFLRTEIALPVIISKEQGQEHDQSYYNNILIDALHRQLKMHHTSHTSLQAATDTSLLMLISAGAVKTLYKMVKGEPHTTSKDPERVWLPAGSDVDTWVKYQRFKTKRDAPPLVRLTPQQVKVIEQLNNEHCIRLRFNAGFFLNGDSQEPEIAGIYSALVGSLLTLGVAIMVAVPIGIGSAIFLEEFAPKGRFFDLLEVNINNLAAVPTIIFGLLGLAVFLNILHLPRSASLAGGLTLALIILPTIIIASRTALKTVPISIRQAAQGLGASKIQTVFHHVLPLATPGMLTGILLGLVRAMGESAPLLMLGMVAFIVEVPDNILDPATVLPVQIYSWAKNPSRGFVENTSAATLVLLVFLFVINSFIIFLRRKFERKW